MTLLPPSSSMMDRALILVMSPLYLSDTYCEKREITVVEKTFEKMTGRKSIEYFRF